jgi:prepilin-type N-terminal cleavage/methylation domain-containing protein
MRKTEKVKGFTLIELLVVVAVFSILAILATQSLALSLRGSRKSESIVHVREELSRAMSVMERQIRNASRVVCTDADTLTYTDQYYNQGETFQCVIAGTDSYIASSSARITSPKVRVSCGAVFSCAGTSPESVTVTLVGEDASAVGVEGASVTISTKVNLRTY